MYFPNYKVYEEGDLKKKVVKYITSEHIPNKFKNLFQLNHKLGIDKNTKHILYIDSHGAVDRCNGANFIGLNTLGAHVIHYGCPLKTLFCNQIGTSRNIHRKYVPYDRNTTIMREMRLRFRRYEHISRACITHINLENNKIVQYDMRPTTKEHFDIPLSTMLENFKNVVNNQYEVYINACRREKGEMRRITFSSNDGLTTITDSEGINNQAIINIIEKTHKEKNANQHILVKRRINGKFKFYMIYNKRISKKMTDIVNAIPHMVKFVSIDNLKNEFMCQNVINLTEC